METQRNSDNDRLTVRCEPKTKKEMIEIADKLDVSLAWVIKWTWKHSKDALKKLIV